MCESVFWFMSWWLMGGHWHLEGKDWNAKYSKIISAWSANSALVGAACMEAGSPLPWTANLEKATEGKNRSKTSISFVLIHHISFFFWLKHCCGFSALGRVLLHSCSTYDLDALGWIRSGVVGLGRIQQKVHWLCGSRRALWLKTGLVPDLEDMGNPGGSGWTTSS